MGSIYDHYTQQRENARLVHSQAQPDKPDDGSYDFEKKLQQFRGSDKRHKLSVGGKKKERESSVSKKKAQPADIDIT